MQSGVNLSKKEIKKIIAEHFHVSEDKVRAAKNSYIVVQEPDKPTPKESD